MEQLANDISDILADYHSFDQDFKFTPDQVLKWVNQFEKNDRKFILEEFLYLLKQKIYLSEAETRRLLIHKMKKMAEVFKFKNVVSFLENVVFLDLQSANKSQHTLLTILDEELVKEYDMSLEDCGSVSEKYNIYLDDVLATGATVFYDCQEWLKKVNEDGESNCDKVEAGNKILVINVFCLHTWGGENFRWRIKYAFDSDILRKKILIRYYYSIQNHPSLPEQGFNFAYPCLEHQSEAVLDFFEKLKADKDAQFAFREINKPEKEGFFSSAENRNRFETILVSKGVELLNQAKKLLDNQRPLGMTNPTKKTLGTGTLFFTWRNISNTTPIVFWWKSDNWYPLFPVANRGKK